MDRPDGESPRSLLAIALVALNGPERKHVRDQSAITRARRCPVSCGWLRVGVLTAREEPVCRGGDCAFWGPPCPKC